MAYTVLNPSADFRKVNRNYNVIKGRVIRHLDLGNYGRSHIKRL